jgi:predicted metal-dependent enzyme (double-stranded beta helix superfamily)
MCDLLVSHGLEPLEHDEWVLDVPPVRSLIGDVRAAVARSVSAAEVCRAVEPSFNQLLTEPGWLPAQFQQDVPQSGMGGGIGQWLLFRAADRSLCLFSLVVPSGSRTPVHDHLAWGLIGLYRGNQDEEFYRPGDGRLELLRRRALNPGDWYALLPPTDDVHCVRTTSQQTSVSIHLLANDTGCVLRHVYDEETGAAHPFRSGYVNAACPEGEPIVARA